MDFFETITTVTTDSNTKINIFENKKALIVDDFENFRLSIKKILVDIGVGYINMVQNGKFAITACSQQDYDIIICDFNLGEGKNGQQVLEELRHLNLLKSDSLFLMVTADTTREVVMGALECQPDAYLSKPINQSVLKRRLEKLVAQTKELAPVKELIKKELYTDAIEMCHEKINDNNRFKNWYEKQLCELYILTKQFDEAKGLCNQILSERKADWPHQMLGKINQAQGNTKEAIKNYEDLLKTNPSFMSGYDEMAEIYLSQGNIEKAQKVIQKAIKISPNAIHRQQKLGKISRDAGSYDVAVNAFRQTVELGKNSCYDSAYNYIDLATSIIDLSEEDENADKSKAINESTDIFKKINKKFDIDINISIRIELTKAKAAHQQKDVELITDLLEKINVMYKDEGDKVLSETKLEIGKTLFLCGQKETGEEILYNLIEENSNDKSLINRILEFLDEPISKKNKNEAAASNKEGIVLYEQKEYEKAIEKFQKALELSPRHPGLNLNLIQACLYLLQKEFRKKWLDLCEQSLSNVEHLRESHPQYNRLQKLMKPVEKWKQKSKKL